MVISGLDKKVSLSACLLSIPPSGYRVCRSVASSDRRTFLFFNSKGIIMPSKNHNQHPNKLFLFLVKSFCFICNSLYQKNLFSLSRMSEAKSANRVAKRSDNNSLYNINIKTPKGFIYIFRKSETLFFHFGFGIEK